MIYDDLRRDAATRQDVHGLVAVRPATLLSAADEIERLHDVEKQLRWLVRSRSFSTLSADEFHASRALLDKLDQGRTP